MKVTNEHLAASMAFKDIIRDALIIKPMSYSEMLIHFDITRSKLTNHMTQLKKYGFVKYSEAEKHMKKDKRKYYVVPDMGSYADMMSERRAVNAQMSWKDSHKADINKNARVVVTCDQYHTSGNRTKVSAWSGYASMGSM